MKIGTSATRVLFACWLCIALIGIAAADATDGPRVVIMVWDGLRPDLINRDDTPNLFKLRRHGIEFADHHSTYPTLTMINASSFATGAYPGTHGFYGNWIWLPQARGRDAAGREVDFSQPVFTEDYAILKAIDAAQQGKLFTVPTLFEIAERAGLSTAVVGKGGPTFLQNRHGATPFIDDKTATPLSVAQGLLDASLPLPKLWRNAYPADVVLPVKQTADPTASGPVPRMKDGVTPDPSSTDAKPYDAVNLYHAGVFNDYVLPQLKPRLSMLWLRNPDSTEHAFGPGSASTRAALRANDAILGSVLKRLDELGLAATTNIMVVSDHGHSHVSGPFEWFPLRTIRDGVLGEIDANGFAVSGAVRSADLLRRAGLPAFDGFGAQCDPIMSGIDATGMSIYLHRHIDAQFACKTGITTTDSFVVPRDLPQDQSYAVIATDGGSEYFYVPSHDREFVARLVRILQSRKQYGAIFIDSDRYGELPGTLPLSAVRLADAYGRNPDLIVSFNFDAEARIGGVPGIEYASGSGYGTRGMHGSFSPRDVHNVLIASGPAFKSTLHVDRLPTANVDVAPTVAHILGLALPDADGRVLREVLRATPAAPRVLHKQVLRSRQPATGLRIAEPIDPDGNAIDARATRYIVELKTKVVRQEGRDYRYFDSARAVRD